MSRTWKATAPANIALIKYMGKTDVQTNIASNPSLSLSLDNFISTVEITRLENAAADQWEPLAKNSAIPTSAGTRFLNFFGKQKASLGVIGNFLIRSGNNFPSDCGLASSASSFAALTKALDLCFSDILDRPPRSPAELALVSRSGSGSSCRSFFSPWCTWEGNFIAPLPSALPALRDLVVILAEEAKKISSSEAHKRVATSPLMLERGERATKRHIAAKAAIANGDFPTLNTLAWADFWDMHSMFHTAEPPFSYFLPSTLAVLRFAEKFWDKHGYGPIATVDAGPNVHLLVQEQEREPILRELQNELGNLRILESGAAHAGL